MKYTESVFAKELHNQATLFKSFCAEEPRANLKRWLIVSLIAFATVLALAVTTQIYQKKQLGTLLHRETELTHSNEDLKDKIHAYEMLHDATEKLHHNINEVNMLKSSQNPAVATLMRSISLSVKTHTWITHVQVAAPAEVATDKKGATPAHGGSIFDKVTLLGQTDDQKEIAPFKKYLARVASVTEFKLDFIQKGGSAKSSQFRLSGKMIRQATTQVVG